METNGGGRGGSPSGSESESSPVTPPESQSPLHFLADLAEQKSREEKKGEHVLILPFLNSQCSFKVLTHCAIGQAT